jgi:hypothetical protein
MNYLMKMIIIYNYATQHIPQLLWRCRDVRLVHKLHLVHSNLLTCPVCLKVLQVDATVQASSFHSFVSLWGPEGAFRLAHKLMKSDGPELNLEIIAVSGSIRSSPATG